METSPKRNSAAPRVALTFDDSVSNQETLVAPLLAQYGFGATFYTTEFTGEGNDRFDTDKRQYMDWRQITKLHQMGFEIGNHSWHHPNISRLDPKSILAEIEMIEQRCAEYGIPRPCTYAHPGSHESVLACEILKRKGYLCSRSGNDRPYRPTEDSIWSIPSFGITDKTEALFDQALSLAVKGEIVIFTFHGVPDFNHPACTTSPEAFRRMMAALHQTGLPVVSLKSLVECIGTVATGI